MTKSSSPTVLKRSFIYRKLQNAGLTGFSKEAEANSSFDSHRQAEHAGLLDFSLMPRAGFRGLRVLDQLRSAGLPIPETHNQAVASELGEWILRLGPKEYWILGSLQDAGARVETLKGAIPPNTDCYPLYCQDSHAWLALTGAHLPAIMAKLCGVDLSKATFPPGAIAQTSVARINAIVVHHTLAKLPCFSLMFDSAAAEYLWDSLLDAVQEFGGRAIGLDALK